MITAETLKTVSTSRLFTDKKLAFSAAILVIFHAVGFLGLVFSGQSETYQNLTPLHLLLTNALLFLNHKNFNAAFFLFAWVTFLAGFLAEVLGVHTGLLFGNYVYGQALGFKLWNVPLLIGLNWVMLVYCIGITVRNWTKKPWLATILAAGIMVLLDHFIEPVAMRFDFWSWQNHQIPLQNYAGWLLLSLILQFYFQRSNVTKTNPLAPLVFGLQALFFIALNIMNK
ncbi:carotenoid biosynthesis protein [Adhaeribacter sp. BT258]|uniref:Carotenoid biosynthesis protein n=1 Tax=Adhaeribacter terrigena TaxID=2793070 RepID=A0ABS1C4A0_9BACT|nr:carotenoid biosynthesis protein [Adhaeribacter terrigena]MBK0404231.1 carotenoid biosynthesis protein [Adhaeribacter terrigena]